MACVALLGCLVIFGWHYDIIFLIRPISKLAAMNPTTALRFVLSALAFLFVTSGQTSKIIVGNCFVAIVMAITVVHMVDFIFDYSFNVDLIFLANKLGIDAIVNPMNRMAPNTAISFLVITMILLSIRKRERNLIILNQCLSSIIALIAIFSIIGYVYELLQNTVAKFGLKLK